jgi:hypothetical protein
MSDVSILLDGLTRVRESATPTSARNEVVGVANVLSALNSFTEIVRYLNTRRSTGAILDLDDVPYRTRCT